MGNHLSGQTSPYLLQHAENPVDWYPWGEEAFEKAEREDKPIFLSIGYSTCHWCHVMAEESFENEQIAAILNASFVAVKVDREERPDIDSVYMTFCQAFTGSGGWPATLFLTPAREPFFAGTYFPPHRRPGMTGLDELLKAVARKWQTERAELFHSAAQAVGELRSRENENRQKAAAPEAVMLSEEGMRKEALLPEEAAEQFRRSFDREYGGFGREPKFPCPHNLLFLLNHAVRTGNGEDGYMVQKTLLQMRKGGLFDQIGFGFSRYSTDRSFLIPHFEKMLYDNALLILAYAAAGRVLKEDVFLDTAEQTAEYLLQELHAEDGGFYSAQDADSEGEEGSYYAFSRGEISEVLGEEGEAWNQFYGMTEKGNFEGKNIPNLLHYPEGKEPEGMVYPGEEARRKLYSYRRGRKKLHTDRKRLTAWNALAVTAFAFLYRTTGKEAYLRTAEETERFLRSRLVEGERLFITLSGKIRSGAGLLTDYAYHTAALLELYDAVRREDYLREAKRFCRAAEELFYDRENGGYFLYGTEQENLILRPKETYDGALPSGNSVMAWNLVRLHFFTGEEEYRQSAKRQLAYMAKEAEEYPAGSSLYLLALELFLNPPDRITVVMEPGACETQVRASLPLTADVRILSEPAAGYERRNGRTTFYVCRGQVCLPPENEFVPA